MITCPQTSIAQRLHFPFSNVMFNVPYNFNTSIKVMIPYIYFIYLFNYEVLFNFLSLRSPLHAKF